ncbi:amidohydrolase family protein [Sphingomonas sp. BAUL-RG-20F-R05-02]|uniref:amidohydrolase family protein n=1 Tax=Sphingomonas sp. BAUL-RG-20F-R05-02 TaxID=2914830 RepID=UPI001F598960|nr:amidohydrolase family protein [Sphingomonas sp. BAUL-RG-20F-R05-02]
MLIDAHAHLFTSGMLNQHDFWGPFMRVQGLTVGHFSLGTKQKAKASNDAEAETNLLARMTHEARRALMEQRGVDMLVLSTPSHAFMYWAGEFGTQYARTCNDELSAFCAVDPEHFAFWGHANLADPAGAVVEIDRAVRQLGAKGICVGGTNFDGIATHDERLFPVWEKLAELDVPVMVHGFNQSIYLGERHHEDAFETSSILGDCFDETLFFWYLICSGALDTFPNLKAYITHAGGMAVFQLGRLSELNANMAPDARNRRPLLEYMPHFFFDLDVHHPALRRGVAEVVGIDNLVHGTNFGGAYDNGDPTDGLGLSAADAEKIRSGNAIRLLKLNQHAMANAA